MSDVTRPRPEALPLDHPLAERSYTPQRGVERAASAVAYHAGIEIVLTTAIGGPAALVLSPVAIPIVAALVGVWSVIDRRTRRHVPLDEPAAKDTATEDVEDVEDATEGAAAREGIA